MGGNGVMRKKYFLTSNNKGQFFLNGKDISGLWYDFFAGLTMEQEKDCGKIFIKRYAKSLTQH